MKHYDVIWIDAGQATGTIVPRPAHASKSMAELMPWILDDLKPLEDA